jgi:hypothetical protein
MDSNINILVTLSNGDYLLRVALKLDSNKNGVNPETIMYALEPENKEKISSFLPPHCKSFGQIVEVKEIFEIKDLINQAESNLK